MLKKNKCFILIILLPVVLFANISCVKKYKETVKYDKTILVVPFIDLKDIKSDEEIDKFCDSCKQFNVEMLIKGKPGETVASYFADQLVKKYNVIYPQEISINFNSLEIKLFNFNKNISKITERYKVDYVVLGIVEKYFERQGSNYAAALPASVAMEISILSGSSGGLISKIYIDETQKSLLENLLDVQTFYQASGKWLSVDQLAQMVLERTANKLTLQ